MGAKKKAAKAPTEVPAVEPTPSSPEALVQKPSKPAAAAPPAAAKPNTSAAQTAALGYTEFVLAMFAVGYSVMVGAGEATSWPALLGLLVAGALALLGWENIQQITADLHVTRTKAGALRVPLTDAPLDIDTANKFANSCQVREKGLKILQYVLRGSAYWELVPSIKKELKALSKTTSVARRFFKFCRWVKHFEDLAEANEEKPSVMRALLYIRVAANFGADWAEDVCSLERIGLLPKGTLSVEFMLFAEYCQLVLALVEVFVTSAKLRKDEEKTAKVVAAGEPGSKDAVKQQRKLAMTRLELVKYVSDIGKAVFDCELKCSHEGVFIGCSLFSAIVSTHKNMFKVLK